MIGGIFGLWFGLTPAEMMAADQPAGSHTVSGPVAAVAGCVLFTLVGLVLAAAVTLIRARRRGGRPAAPPARPVHSLSALFWLNLVVVVVVAILVAPSMAGPDHGLVFGFCGGLAVAASLRLRGVAAGAGLTKRGLHVAVYALHGFSALVALMVVVVPAPGDRPGAGVAADARTRAGGARHGPCSGASDSDRRSSRRSHGRRP